METRQTYFEVSKAKLEKVWVKIAWRGAPGRRRGALGLRTQCILHRRGTLDWSRTAYRQRVQKLLELAQIAQIAQKCMDLSVRASIIIFYPSWVPTL